MMLYCSSFIFLSLSSISLLQQHLLQAFSTSTLSKSRIIPKRYSNRILDLLNPRSYTFKLFSVYEKDKVGTEPLDWPNLGSVKLI